MPKTADTDKALWVGYAGGVLFDGTELVPGVTVCEISRGEAEASDHWEPIVAKAKRASKPRAKAKTVPSESAGTQESAGAPSKPAATVATADGSAD